ncbi:hypothetical protein [Dyadobacter sp. CY312]|uniref:hypothetical protein n=1 Tax=Dyadobacter sp. CY312 TaxID=2907303 RepID=UPI001F40EFE8|nr:hypothetical protein [Dyadobacter sp. CY312]MCE7039224.1 hypothetical protein [Dyadobacter sp. CY312]
MKPELTLELKAKFIALYFGQDVWRNDNSLFCNSVVNGRRFTEGVDANDYLLLRPLSQISDEEAIEVAKIVCKRHNRHYKTSEIDYQINKKRKFDIELIVKGHPRYIVQIDSDGVGFVDYYLGGAGRINYYTPGQFESTDYLRSIGIAIHFLGYSVDELESAGWIKLK